MAEEPGLGFGGLLRQLRAETRLTQEELASAAGLSPRSVSDLERGVNRTARKDTADLLAAALGLAGPARAAFVAAARGRTPPAEALAVVRAGAAPALTLAESFWEGCPYLGLTPFREQDTKVFYGRGDLVAQLVKRLAGRLSQPGMLLVTGESGAGKSSLLAAGLMPRLAAAALGPGSEQWPRRLIRPASRPLRELAAALAGVADTDPDSVYRSLAAVPGETPMLAELAVRTALGRGASTARGDDDAPADAPRLILIIDQFEELFTGQDTEAGRTEREAFVAALDAAAARPAGPRRLPSALVILAVRADFLGRLIAYPALKAALDAGPFTVGPMSEADLRLAMTGPAAEAGLVVGPDVTEAVIADLREGTWGGTGSGVLPLMSQAMAATWESREGTELTLRAYRRAGGVADSVNRAAQAAYTSLSRRPQEVARLVFTQLTTVTLDGQFERRRCRRADLSSPGVAQAEIDTVIDAFSARRLLVLGRDSVEISHDVLLQAWKRLRDWLGDDQLDRALYGQVVADAQTWDLNDRDPAYLYRPGRLAAIAAAVARWDSAPARYPPLPATGEAFLRAGRLAARRSARQRRTAFVVMAALTVLALVASAIAFDQRSAAVHQRDQAIYNQVVADALQFGSSDTSLAAQLNLAAYRIHPTQDVASRLLDTENTPLAASVAAGAGPVNVVAFSPGGGLLAIGGSDGTVRLWDVAGTAPPFPLGQPLASGPGGGLAGGPVSVLSVAFRPDGHVLASVNSDGTVFLWNIGDPAHPRSLGRLETGAGSIYAIAFSPDGHLLATGGSSGTDSLGTVQLWNVTDARHPEPLGHARASQSDVSLQSMAFGPDGRVIASDYSDGTLRLWNVADPAHPRPLGPSLPQAAFVSTVAFSPDGRTLASGGSGSPLKLWNVADPVRPQPLGPKQAGLGAIGSMAFSPDGRLLASGGLNGQVSLWDAADPASLRVLGLPFSGGSSSVDSVAFSPDGRTLASGSLDGGVRLWNLPQTIVDGRAAGPVPVAFSGAGHTLASGDGSRAIRLLDVADPARPRPLGPSLPGAASSVAFSPDGRLLASGNSDDTVRLWDVADPARPRPLGPIRLDGGVFASSVAFSPDGRLLASGNSDDTVRLWDVADPARPRPLGPVVIIGTGGVVRAVAFSRTRHLMASADETGTIRLWDISDPGEPSPLGVAILTGFDAVFSLAFSPDGRTLATGDYGGTIQLWNLADPAYLRSLGAPLAGGGDRILAVAFSPDGRLLAGGGDDGAIRLWTVARPSDPRPLGVPLTGSTAAVDAVAFSPDGQTLASGSQDGTTRLWDLDVRYAIGRICAAAGGLTPGQWRQYIPQLPYRASCPG